MRSFHDGMWSWTDEYDHYALFEAAVAVTGLKEMYEAMDSRVMADATIDPEESGAA